MTKGQNCTNEDYFNSDNKTELANIGSVGENIIFDKKMTPNGLANNKLYQIGYQLKPKIVNDNSVAPNENRVEASLIPLGPILEPVRN